MANTVDSSTSTQAAGGDAVHADRKYHNAAAPYTLPNDDAESKRLNGQHNGIRTYFGGNNAGAKWPANPRKILEIGSGNGQWAMEVAYQFPNAEVIGIDISPVKSEHQPPNCKFQIINFVKEPWPFGPDEFDIVHCRLTTVHIQYFKALMDKAIESTAPGGIMMFEDVDSDFTSELEPVPPSIDNFMDIYRSFFSSNQVDPRPGQQLAPYITASKKFSETHEHVIPAPMGAWTRDNELNDVGIAMRDALVGAGQSQHERLFKFGMTKEIVDEWAKAMNTPENKLYIPFYFVWARKKAPVL